MGKPTVRIKDKITLSFNEKNKVLIYGPLANKNLCIFMLTEAIKIVHSYDPPKIITPKVNLVPDPIILKPNG